MLASLAARALPMLAKTVLPALGVGALTGLASSGIQKVMGSGTGPSMGQGLYLKKGGCVCQVETDGKGLYLGPVSGSGFAAVGDGLYLKKSGILYEGKSLLSSIPIVGPFLESIASLYKLCHVSLKLFSLSKNDGNADKRIVSYYARVGALRSSS